MRFFLIIVGALLAIGGATGLLFGLEISDIERGQTQAIVGAVLLVGGFLTIALSVILGRLENLSLHVNASKPIEAEAPATPKAAAATVDVATPPFAAPSFVPPPVSDDSLAPIFPDLPGPSPAPAPSRDDLRDLTLGDGEHQEPQAEDSQFGTGRTVPPMSPIVRPGERPRLGPKRTNPFAPLRARPNPAPGIDAPVAAEQASEPPADMLLTGSDQKAPRRNIFLDDAPAPATDDMLFAPAPSEPATDTHVEQTESSNAAFEPASDIFAFDLVFDKKTDVAKPAAPEPALVSEPASDSKPVPTRSMTLPRGTWPTPPVGSPAGEGEAGADRETPHNPIIPQDEPEPPVEAFAPDVATAPHPGTLVSELRPEHEVEIIGRHEANGATYVMYADGIIDAETSTGIWRFNSLDELKAHIESQGGDET